MRDFECNPPLIEEAADDFAHIASECVELSTHGDELIKARQTRTLDFCPADSHVAACASLELLELLEREAYSRVVKHHDRVCGGGVQAEERVTEASQHLGICRAGAVEVALHEECAVDGNAASCELRITCDRTECVWRDLPRQRHEPLDSACRRGGAHILN